MKRSEMTVIWHDVECGGYAADLELWRDLADEGSGSALDLGCGTGRVGLRLAAEGHRVTGLDVDVDLVDAFNRGAAELPAVARVGDARDFALDSEFELVLAPMQLVQLLSSGEERVACLRRVAAHLAPGGRAALAIVEELPTPVDGSTPLPDAREVDGWVYSSLPIDLAADSGSIRVRRLRQTVSPAGDLSDEVNEVELCPLSAADLEREAAEAGLRPLGRRAIPATDAHVGSTVVLLEKES